MSCTNEAVVGVGLPYADLLGSDEDFDEHFDEPLEVIHPWYDADTKYCYIGVVAYKVEGTKEINMAEAQMKLYRAMDEFRKLTGKSGKVFLSTSGH